MHKHTHSNPHTDSLTYIHANMRACSTYIKLFDILRKYAPHDHRLFNNDPQTADTFHKGQEVPRYTQNNVDFCHCSVLPATIAG